MAKIAKIPIIDISGHDQAQVAKDLVEAAIEHGFVYIKNTGEDIPADAIDGAFEISKRLFDAPLSEKQACTIQKNNQGWSGMNYETLDPANQRVGDFKEAFNFGAFHAHRAQQPLPATLTRTDEAQISAFRDRCYHLSLKLTTLLGHGLDVTPPTFFTHAHERARGPSGTILRFLRYPPRSAIASPTAAATTTTTTTTTPATTTTTTTTTRAEAAAAEAEAEEAEKKDDDDVRAGAHSDYGSLTLLFRLRGQPGLEVLGADGKTWAPVPVVPVVRGDGDGEGDGDGDGEGEEGEEGDGDGDGDKGEGDGDAAPPLPPPPVLVNVGDLLSYWTGGLLRSTVHRVVFPKGEGESVEGERDGAATRYSIAYFCHPFGGAELGPVPSERVRAYKGGLAEGNPYAARRVMTADEHLQMRLKASYAQLYEEKEKEA